MIWHPSQSKILVWSSHESQRWLSFSALWVKPGCLGILTPVNTAKAGRGWNLSYCVLLPVIFLGLLSAYQTPFGVKYPYICVGGSRQSGGNDSVSCTLINTETHTTRRKKGLNTAFEWWAIHCAKFFTQIILLNFHYSPLLSLFYRGEMEGSKILAIPCLQKYL